MSPSFASLEPQYDQWIESAHSTRPNAAMRAAERIARGWKRYQAVERATGVPAEWIGAIHYRESACDFRGCLHNGQHIIGTGQRTTIAPVGRGPFATWEAAAIDALQIKGLVNTGIDWTDPMKMYQAERFNGFGYRNPGHGARTPYVLAGTNLQIRGKYSSDGHYDPNLWDPQLGVWPVILAVRENMGYKKAPADGFDIIGWLKKSLAPLMAGGLWGTLQEVGNFVTDWRTFAILAFGGSLYLLLSWQEEKQAVAYREGRLQPKSELEDYEDDEPLEPSP
jgi:lysozyme family protein